MKELIISLVLISGIAFWINYEKVHVKDGDTIGYHLKTYRLYGIDAPETRQACGTIQCGRIATQKVENFISDKDFSCDVKSQDKYERLVAVCYADGKDIGRFLVENGYAQAFMHDDYKKEEAIAKKEKRGFWATEFMQPYKYREIYK